MLYTQKSQGVKTLTLSKEAIMVFVSFKPFKSNPHEYYGNVDNISDSPCKGVPDYIILLHFKSIFIGLVHFPDHPKC